MYTGYPQPVETELCAQRKAATFVSLVRDLIRTSIDKKYLVSTKRLHTWIILVIVKQHLVKTDRLDGG